MAIISAYSGRSSGLRTVSAGDLITAAYVNDLVGTILGLERRIAELESICQGTFKITDIDIRYEEFAFVFDVAGSGLDPENLESFGIRRLALEWENVAGAFAEFQPENLTGDDDRIAFAAHRLGDLALSEPPPGAAAEYLAGLRERVRLQINAFIRSRGGSAGFTLAIRNKAGATASRDFTIKALA